MRAIDSLRNTGGRFDRLVLHMNRFLFQNIILIVSLAMASTRCRSPEKILTSQLRSGPLVCYGEHAVPYSTPAGRAWEARYTCSTPGGPTVPFAGYFLDVRDPVAHTDGREGETKISVSRNCIVSFIYMGIDYDNRPYRVEASGVLRTLALTARDSGLCK